MCDPVSLGVAAVALSAIGTGVSAYGAYTQSESANQAAEYNAKVNERNAEISKMQGDYAKAKGEVDARKHLQQVSVLEGKQRAGFAGSGVLVDAGSPADVGQETAAFGALDALTIKRNAAREAWGYDVQGMNYGAEASLSRMSKGNSLLAGGTTLLTGAANTLSTASYLTRQ